MPGVPQRVECPNCDHVFSPTGRSINRSHRRNTPVVHTCEGPDCWREFETTRSEGGTAKRFCSRDCQLKARRA